MARPLKEGLDYFPHDTDAVNDEKIEALRALYGNDGYAFYFIHLERIYRNKDFEINISDAETIQILAKKCGINFNLYEQILKTAIKHNCFDKNEYEKRRVLTSKGIKNRAIIVVEKREKMKSRYEERKKIVSDAETPQETTPESTQSKGKESKGKESKINKDKDIESEEKHSDPVPYEKIKESFNNTCKSLAKVQSLSKSRKEKIRVRYLELKSLEKFNELFQKVEDSSFLKGNNDKNWKATFDWLMDNDKNYLKVLEGNYNKQYKSKVQQQNNFEQREFEEWDYENLKG